MAQTTVNGRPMGPLGPNNAPRQTRREDPRIPNIYATTHHGVPVTNARSNAPTTFGLRSIHSRNALSDMSNTAPNVVRTTYKNANELTRYKENIPMGTVVLPRNQEPKAKNTINTTTTTTTTTTVAPVTTSVRPLAPRMPVHHDDARPNSANVVQFSGSDSAIGTETENWTTFEPIIRLPSRAPYNMLKREASITHSLPVPHETYLTRKELQVAAKMWVYINGARDPVDAAEEDADPSMVSEYTEEIFEYFRELEGRTLPSENYMVKQSDINWKHRADLMDWVVAQHTRLNLLPETLHLTVNIIDRFLSGKVINRARLQLVGASAMLIAAKYEEINVPSIQEIEYVADGNYALEDIIKAERYMLNIIGFDLGAPGPMSFLRRISKADDYDTGTRTIAKYFLDVAIMNHEFVGSKPSYVAAASLCLSRFICDSGPWTVAHVHLSGYTYQQLLPAMLALVETCRSPHTHKAVWQKHCDDRSYNASEYVLDRIGYLVLPNEHYSPLDLVSLLKAPYENAANGRFLRPCLSTDSLGSTGSSTNNDGLEG